MSNTSPSEVYTNIIKDKKVIFVGPAPTLIKKNMGSWIDSFDVIARTNGSIFLTNRRDFKKDYGSRCDVLFSNVQFHRECGPFYNLIPMWKEKVNLKIINFKTIPQRFRDKYNELIPVRTIQHLEVELRKTIKGVLMGPICIADLLSYKPESLYITGFNFYVNKPHVFIPGDYREYYPDYLPERIRKKADIKNIGRIDPHDKYSNTKYIYDLYAKGLIDMDDTMKKLAADIIKGENI